MSQVPQMGRAVWAAVALAAAAFYCLVPSLALASEPPAVVRQVRDDDCGAAAVATAFALVGVTVAEQDLLRGHVTATGRGLRASDLVQMAAASGTGLSLRGSRVLPGHFVDAINQGPAIVMLHDIDESAGYGFGHFVVVESYSAEHGYLVADPAIGERGWVTADELLAKMNKIEVDGRMRVLALRLVNDAGVPVAQRVGAIGGDLRYLRLDDLRRTRRSLPPGRTAVILSVGKGIDRETIRGGANLALVTPQQNIGVEVLTGIGKDRDIAVGIGAARTAVRLKRNGATAFDFGSRTALTNISVVANQTFRRAAGGSVQGSLGILFDGKVSPSAVLVGANLSQPMGNAMLTGAVEARAGISRSQLDISISPSIGGSFDLSRSFSLDFGAAAHITGSGRHIIPEVSAGTSLRLSDHVLLQARYVRNFPGDGASSDRFQLSLVHVIPRKLRRR